MKTELNRARELAGLPVHLNEVKFAGKEFMPGDETKFITRDSTGLIKYHKEQPTASSEDKWDCTWTSKGEKVISGVVEAIVKELK